VRRRRDGVFALAWDAALVLAREAAEQVLADRALNGVTETIYYRGEAVGARTRFDGRLLLAHLARLDKRCEAGGPALAAAQCYDELLAAIADGTADAGFIEDEHGDTIWDPAGPSRADHAAICERDAIEELYAAEDEGEDEAELGAEEAGQDAEAAAEADAAEEAALAHDAMLAEVRAAALAEWDENFAALTARVDALIGEDVALEYKMLGAPERFPCTVSTSSTWPRQSLRSSPALGAWPRAGSGCRMAAGPAGEGNRLVRTFAHAAALGLVPALLAAPAAALAAPVTLVAHLTGAAETAGGDPDGAGRFTAEIDPENGDFCYSLSAAKIAAPTMAHVHSGVAGEDGPPVLDIAVTSDECLAREPALLKPIADNPAGYYVNIHTADFPKGAVRGQLGKK